MKRKDVKMKSNSLSGHVNYYVVYEWDKRVISSKLFLTKELAEKYAKDIERQGKKIRGIEEYGF